MPIANGETISSRMWTGGITCRRAGGSLFASLLLLVASAAAQESPAPQPSATPPARAVRIAFLPPPIEGTFSLGIYDAKGKLVRVLHREAELEDFEIKDDALAATWDGKDDQGVSLSPGKYHARGFAVGDLEVEGVGFFFNDWVTDEESPRIQKVHNLRLVSGEKLAMLVSFAGGAEGSVACDPAGNLLAGETNDGSREDERFPPGRSSIHAESGKLSVQKGDGWEEVSWPTLVAPQAADVGKGGTVWAIDREVANTETLVLKQLSETGEFLRRMAFPAEGPQPKVVQASPSDDRIYLLEEGPLGQRVRGLSLVCVVNEGSETLSDWKVDFAKEIIRHKDFAIENGKPVVAGGKTPQEKLSVVLKENPLQDDKKGRIDLAVAYDASGSFLKTADGLPLQKISETRHLTRIVLSPRGDKSVDVFQDDDSVVEQFRVSRLDEMMAFDCGEIELK